MTVLRVNTLAGIGSTGAGTVFAGKLEFNSQNYVILPKGTTDDRVGVGSTPGALRYNTDSNKVELYDGSQWTEVQASRPDLNGGARGVFGGGASPTLSNVIDYITIASTGNAIDFGDLLFARSVSAAASSSTRGVFAGGYIPSPASNFNTIQYVTISSTGNAISFGSLPANTHGATGVSNSTRALFAGGYNYTPLATIVNTINYITIASEGNGVDFGDLYLAVRVAGGIANPTRGVFAGGGTPSAPNNTIQYVTISTLGNSTDFGDLTVARTASACSNSTRGIIFGGFVPGTATNTIDYITISTLGNAVKFGEMTVARFNTSACSSPVRAVCAGDGLTPTNFNVIDYVTILTQGNAVDFGDLTLGRQSSTGCSNAHGGL